MASAFHVQEHVVEAQHIREFPKATATSQEDTLYLAVKQYTPKTNPDPQPGDVTIIAAHANGFVKEVYEALWEDLVVELEKHQVRVRGIWIADAAWEGNSGVLNENKLGNDPCWFDYSRDLNAIINRFRMPRPLVGVGHSFGGLAVTDLALMHPRLFSSLVLLDPTISHFFTMGRGFGGITLALASTRRDVWPSRQAAEAAFKRSAFYSSWDPRVLDAWSRHGIREVPTALHKGPDGAVTLTTTKHQEVFTYYRPRYRPRHLDQDKESPDEKRRRLPDEGPPVDPDFPFYRPEPPMLTDRLPVLRPGVLWLFGERSQVCTPDTFDETVAVTGTGTGGSGGVAAGRVEAVTVQGYGHLVPMEAPGICARHAASFIARDLEKVWRREDDEFRAWAARPDVEKQTMNDDWARWIGPRPPGPSKL